MAEIVWTEPALSDLDAIADYIALQDPAAARRLVHKLFDHVDLLPEHPRLGAVPEELRDLGYRHLVEPPCRVFYRCDAARVVILHVMRCERLLDPRRIAARDPDDTHGAS